MKVRAITVVLLGLVLTGCTALPLLQGKPRDDRPAAPDFVLRTTRGERCALADHRGEVVAIYMTNL